MKQANVAIVGATGAVGEEMLATLIKRNFPVKNLYLFASGRSAGRKIKFTDKEYIVEELTASSFDNKNIDIALFSAGASRSKEFAPYAVKAGAVVVDNSSAFRMDKDVPLVVPEVNAHAIKNHNGIIANPNCSTIQMVVALNPIHKKAVIERVVVSTYQAASGAGLSAMLECEQQMKEVLEGKTPTVEKFAHQLAFNLIPHIDAFTDNGYTKEEMKMTDETKKIMETPEIRVSATCIRVPVMRAHSEAINIETKKHISAKEATDIWKKSEGIIVIDEPQEKKYPMPYFCAGKDEVFIGRIREDISVANGITFWCVADQILKGAALNAIQIAEKLLS